MLYRLVYLTYEREFPDWHGPNASMVAELAYSAIRALQLIV